MDTHTHHDINNHRRCNKCSRPLPRRWCFPCVAVAVVKSQCYTHHDLLKYPLPPPLLFTRRKLRVALGASTPSRWVLENPNDQRVKGRDLSLITRQEQPAGEQQVRLQGMRDNVEPTDSPCPYSCARWTPRQRSFPACLRIVSWNMRIGSARDVVRGCGEGGRIRCLEGRGSTSSFLPILRVKCNRVFGNFTSSPALRLQHGNLVAVSAKAAAGYHR